MNEREFGRKIVRTLDGGLDLPAGYLGRLKAARARALDSQRLVEPSMAVAIADGVASHLAGPSQWFLHVLLPVALLIGGLTGLRYWQESQQSAAATAEVADLDARLLEGDLPIDAYLDHGFEAWLKRSSE